MEDVACILEEKVYHRDILLLTGGFLWTLFWILGQEFDEKRKKFDEDLENKTKARLEKIREQLEKEQSRVLNSSSGASEDTICSLRKEYEEKHTEYAHEILRRITEV